MSDNIMNLMNNLPRDLFNHVLKFYDPRSASAKCIHHLKERYTMIYRREFWCTPSMRLYTLDYDLYKKGVITDVVFLREWNDTLALGWYIEYRFGWSTEYELKNEDNRDWIKHKKNVLESLKDLNE